MIFSIIYGLLILSVLTNAHIYIKSYEEEYTATTLQVLIPSCPDAPKKRRNTKKCYTSSQSDEVYNSEMDQKSMSALKLCIK